MLRLRDQLDGLFHGALGQRESGEFGFESGAPALDLYESKDGFVVQVALPGLKKEDIAISLHEGVLKVSGEFKETPAPTGATFCRCERAHGRFERSITLPAQVDAEKIKATYADGVLTVALTKAVEAQPRQIPVDIK
jgi:HSP20 family protein